MVYAFDRWQCYGGNLFHLFDLIVLMNSWCIFLPLMKLRQTSIDIKTNLSVFPRLNNINDLLGRQKNQTQSDKNKMRCVHQKRGSESETDRYRKSCGSVCYWLKTPKRDVRDDCVLKGCATVWRNAYVCITACLVACVCVASVCYVFDSTLNEKSIPGSCLSAAIVLSTHL